MDDLISRTAAINTLEEPLKVPDTWTDEYAVGERMQWEKDVKALKNLPSAQPEQIYGEDIYYEADGHCEFKCSVCSVEIGVVEGGELDGGRFKFCPKCGVPIKENDDD